VGTTNLFVELVVIGVAAAPDETRGGAGGPRHRATLTAPRARPAEPWRELGDVDPVGPAPVSAPCGNGVDTGHGPPR